MPDWFDLLLHKAASSQTAARWVGRMFYIFPLAVLALVAFIFRFHLAGWSLPQFGLLVEGLTADPVTENQRRDVNFWGGQLLGSLLVVLLTWLTLHTSKWQTFVLNNLLVTRMQRLVMKHLFMQALEDAVFLFTMRQVVVFTAWCVVPPAVASVDTSKWLGHEPWRHWVDARLATLLYITTSLVWYGAKVGLFERPLDPLGRGVVTAALKAAVYGGIAVVRIYPFLNNQHVSVLSLCWMLITRYPIMAMLLGAVAVEPGEYLGRAIRARFGVTLASICAINAVNVASMLWTSAAGIKIAQWLMLAQGAELTTGFTLPMTVSLDGILILACFAVLGMYARALDFLVSSTGLLRCEFGSPQIVSVDFSHQEAVDTLWNICQMYITPAVKSVASRLRTVASTGGLPSDGPSLGRHASADSVGSVGDGSGDGLSAGVGEPATSPSVEEEFTVPPALVDAVRALVSMGRIWDDVNSGQPFYFDVALKLPVYNPAGITLHMHAASVDVVVHTKSSVFAWAQPATIATLFVDPISVPPLSSVAMERGELFQDVTLHVTVMIHLLNVSYVWQHLPAMNMSSLLSFVAADAADKPASSSAPLAPRSARMGAVHDGRSVHAFTMKMHFVSPWTSSLTLSMPLLTWREGAWQGIGLLDPKDALTKAHTHLSSRESFSKLAVLLSQQRARAMAADLASLPAVVQDDLARLLAVLHRVNERGNAAAAASGHTLYTHIARTSSGTAAGLAPDVDVGAVGGVDAQGVRRRVLASSALFPAPDLAPNAMAASQGDADAPSGVAGPGSRVLPAAYRAQALNRMRSATQQDTVWDRLRHAVNAAAQGMGVRAPLLSATQRGEAPTSSTRPPGSGSSYERAVTVADMKDLLYAAYLVSSMFVTLKDADMSTRPLLAVCYEVGVAALNALYDTLSFTFARSRDPLQLCVVTTAVLTLQAVLYRHHVQFMLGGEGGSGEEEAARGTATRSETSGAGAAVSASLPGPMRLVAPLPMVHTTLPPAVAARRADAEQLTPSRAAALATAHGDALQAMGNDINTDSGVSAAAAVAAAAAPGYAVLPRTSTRHAPAVTADVPPPMPAPLGALTHAAVQHRSAVALAPAARMETVAQGHGVSGTEGPTADVAAPAPAPATATAIGPLANATSAAAAGVAPAPAFLPDNAVGGGAAGAPTMREAAAVSVPTTAEGSGEDDPC